MASTLTPLAWGAARQTDEEFIQTLEVQEGEPVDLTRLARLFFSVASTLDGGKTNVRLLQTAVQVREPTAESVRAMLSARYVDYERTVASFKSEVAQLLDAPESRARLHAVLTAGHRTCWELDSFSRLVETYGASTRALITVLSSIEGCELFRRAAFQPSVDGLIREALTGGTDQSKQIRELREELRAMEELLEDLRRIDEEE
jgi:hypothetical protein